MSRFVISPKDDPREVVVGADNTFGYFGQVFDDRVDPEGFPVHEIDNAPSRSALNDWVKSVTQDEVEIPGDVYAQLG